MQERIKFVGAAKMGRASFTSLCAAFGITPKTGYKWLHRFEREGADGLDEKSRRPHGNSRAIPEPVATRVVSLREEHPTWGPRKLVAWLEDHESGWELPVPSTVGELLKRCGLVAPPRQRMRAHAAPRTEPLRHATKPNKVWAMDFKGWFHVGDGHRCDPFTVTDAYSRYLLCCDVHEGPFRGPVWRSLLRTFRRYGLPQVIRVDGGQPWIAPKGDLGLTRLGVDLLKLDVSLERISPGKPQENGRHERFHLTLKQDTTLPPASTLRAQQVRFNKFLVEYNQERPHEALGQRPPARVYRPSPRKLPSRLPEPEYPLWMQPIRVKHYGRISFDGKSFYLSEALRGERVGLVEVDEDCHAVYFSGYLLGHIHTQHPELGMLTA